MNKLADVLHAFIAGTVLLALLVFEGLGAYYCAVNGFWIAFLRSSVHDPGSGCCGAQEHGR